MQSVKAELWDVARDAVDGRIDSANWGGEYKRALLFERRYLGGSGTSPRFNTAAGIVCDDSRCETRHVLDLDREFIAG